MVEGNSFESIQRHADLELEAALEPIALETLQPGVALGSAAHESVGPALDEPAGSFGRAGAERGGQCCANGRAGVGEFGGASFGIECAGGA